MELSQEEIFALLGKKDVEIYTLQREIKRLSNEVVELKKNPPAPRIHPRDRKAGLERFSQQHEGEKPKEEP